MGLPIGSVVNNLPAMQIQSLSQEDLLEEDMALIPVLLPEQPHGQRSLVGYSPWGYKELDVAEHTHAPVYALNRV